MKQALRAEILTLVLQLSTEAICPVRAASILFLDPLAFAMPRPAGIRVENDYGEHSRGPPAKLPTAVLHF